jgi:hypothetical protein
MAQGAFAQSSTTTTPNSNVAQATSSASGSSDVKLRVNYLGVVNGPGLNSENFYQNQFNSKGAPAIDNRFRFLAELQSNLQIGLEARAILAAAHLDDPMTLTAGDFRIMANVKNIYNDGVFNFMVIPRLRLPTSDKSREKNKLFTAAELIPVLNVSPKGSRFSFNTGFTFSEYFYKDSAPNTVATRLINPWLSTEYQINPIMTGFVSVSPEWVVTKNAATAMDSDEVDIGMNIEVIKGWNVQPYIAADLFQMDTQNIGTAAQNMQFNLQISGNIL